MRVMKKVMLSGLMAVLFAGTALAGPGYEACTREEQRLRAAETADCSGLSYIFNPSGCFITRKQLIPYDRGKCREMAAREGVAIEKVEPVKPVEVATPVPPAKVPSAAAVEPLPSRALLPAVNAAALPTEIEQLRAEIAGLREELRRLKEEVSALNQK